MAAHSNPSALLATDQDVSLKHQFGNIFEADGRNMQWEAIFRGDLVNHLRSGNRLDHLALQSPDCNQMMQQDRKDLVRVHGVTVCVNSADAVGVTVRCKSSIRFAFNDGGAQISQMRINGLRINSGKQWVVLAVNFREGHTGFVEQARQTSPRRTIHWVDHELSSA